MSTRLFLVLATAAIVTAGCKSSEESVVEGVDSRARTADVLQSGCMDEPNSPDAQARPVVEEWTDGKPEGKVLLTSSEGTLMGAFNHIYIPCSDAKSSVNVNITVDDDLNLDIEAVYGQPFLGFPVQQTNCLCDYYGSFEQKNFTSGKYHLRLYRSNWYEKTLYYDGTVTIQDRQVVVLDPQKLQSKTFLEFVEPDEMSLSSLPSWLQKMVRNMEQLKDGASDHAEVYQITYNNGKSTGYVITGPLVTTGIDAFVPSGGKARVFTHDGTEQHFASRDEYVEFARGISKWKEVYYISSNELK